MKIDNFILLIISIITLIIITLLTECNKERLLELEQNSIKKIIETFYHFDIKNKNSSGEWGYKITGITPGQYGGRSIQDVQDDLQKDGGHNINSYISKTEKNNNINLFDSGISGSRTDCKTTGYGSCIWSDASGNVISSSDSGAWRKEITSISHNVDPNICGAVGNFKECDDDESGVLGQIDCDNNPIKNTCGNCGSDGKLRYSYSSNPRRQNAYGGAPCDNLNNIMNNYIYIHQYCINPKYEYVIKTGDSANSKEIINYEFILHSDSISRQRPKNSITGRKPPVWNKHNRDMKIDINLGIDKNFCLKEFIRIENMNISFNYQINGTDDDIIPYNTNIYNIINNRNVTTNNDNNAINNTDYEIKKLTYFPNNSTIDSNYQNKIESFEIEIPINDDAIKKKLFIHLNTEKLYNQWIMDVGGIDGVMFGNNKTPIRNLTDYWTTGVDFTNDRALNHIKQRMPGVFNIEQERLHWENMKRSGVSEHGHNERGYNDQLNTIFHLNKNIEVVFFWDTLFRGKRSYPNRWNTEVLNNNRREMLNYQNVINLSTITGIDPKNDLIQSRENQQLRDVIRRQISGDWHGDVSSYICEFTGDSFMKWLNNIPVTYYNNLNTLSIKIKTNTDGGNLPKIDKIKLFNSTAPNDRNTVEYGTKEYQIMGGIMGGVSGTNNNIATVAGNSNHPTNNPTTANNLFNNISYGTDGWSKGWHTEWGGTDTRIIPNVTDGSPAILKIEFTKKRKLSKFILLPGNASGRFGVGNLPSNIKVYGTNTPFDTPFDTNFYKPDKSVLLQNTTYQWSNFSNSGNRQYYGYQHIMHGRHFKDRNFNPSSQDIIDQSQRIILIIPPSSQGYYKNYFIRMDDKIMARPNSRYQDQNPIIIQELFVFEKGIELPTIVSQ